MLKPGWLIPNWTDSLISKYAFVTRFSKMKYMCKIPIFNKCKTNHTVFVFIFSRNYIYRQGLWLQYKYYKYTRIYHIFNVFGTISICLQTDPGGWPCWLEIESFIKVLSFFTRLFIFTLLPAALRHIFFWHFVSKYKNVTSVSKFLRSREEQ